MSLLIMADKTPKYFFFRRKRKNKPLSPKVESYTKQFIRHLPLFNSLAFFLPAALVHFFIAEEISLLPDYPNEFLINEKKPAYALIIASVLTALFIYYRQKNGLQFVYTKHIFSPEDLRQVHETKHKNKIGHYFLAVNLISILFPIVPVSFPFQPALPNSGNLIKPKTLQLQGVT